MPTFLFQARDPSGKSALGLAVEKTPERAGRRLTVLRFDVKRVLPVPDALCPLIGLLTVSRPPKKETARLMRQLELLYSSGIPLVECFSRLSEEGWHSSVSIGARQSLKELEKGCSLSDSLGSVPHFLPSSCLSLIAAGEKSGRLSEGLKRSADILEAEFETIEKIRSALVYPAFTMLIFLLAFFLLVVFVLPKFAEVFEGLSAKVPFIVQLGLEISKLAGQPLAIFCFLQAVVVAVLLINRWLLTRHGQEKIYALSERIAPVRRFLHQNYYANLSFNLSTLIGSGIAVTESVALCSRNCPHPGVRHALNQAIYRLQNGETLADAMENEELPKLMCQFVRIGEETGRFDQTLEYLREIYAAETEAAIERFLALLEPALIIVMGVSVGAFLLSAMLPLMSVLSNLGGM